MSYQNDRFTEIANAIRIKRQISNPIRAVDFASEILQISTNDLVFPESWLYTRNGDYYNYLEFQGASDPREWSIDNLTNVYVGMFVPQSYIDLNLTSLDQCRVDILSSPTTIDIGNRREENITSILDGPQHDASYYNRVVMFPIINFTPGDDRLYSNTIKPIINIRFPNGIFSLEMGSTIIVWTHGI